MAAHFAVVMLSILAVGVPAFAQSSVDVSSSGVPWAIVGGGIGAVVGAIAWGGRLLERHMERRSVAMEVMAQAIVPAIQQVGDKIATAIRVEGNRIVERVDAAERDVMAAVDRAKAEITAAIGVDQRLERVERVASHNTGPHMAVNQGHATRILLDEDDPASSRALPRPHMTSRPDR